MEALRLISRTGIAAVLFISTLVFYGWFTEQCFYVRLLPEVAPTQFNTALCFMIIALACAQLKSSIPDWSRWATYLSATVLLFSGITLMQDILMTNIGIDTLFWPEPFIAEKSPHPGRMSPLTALCFIAINVSNILRLTKKYRAGHGVQLKLVLILVVIFITGSVLLGYFLQISQMLINERMTEQSIITAALFLILSVVLIVQLLQSREFHHVKQFFNANVFIVLVFSWICYLALTV